MFGLRLCNFILPNYILWFAKNEIICTNHKKYSKKKFRTTFVIESFRATAILISLFPCRSGHLNV